MNVKNPRTKHFLSATVLVAAAPVLALLKWLVGRTRFELVTNGLKVAYRHGRRPRSLCRRRPSCPHGPRFPHRLPKSPAHFLALAPLLVLTACGGGGGGAEEEPPCTVAVWGDSIGVGLADSIRAAGFQAQDYAVSGTRAIYRTAEMLATPVTADVVILQWGMNDINNTTAAEHLGRFQAMTSYAQAVGATVIITGISGTVDFVPQERADFNAAVRTIPGVMFADWDVLPYTAADLPDGIHPAGAYRARLVAALMDRVAQGCAR